MLLIQSLFGSATAFCLLSSVHGRALSRRDEFCQYRDVVNDKGDKWDGSAAQLFESNFKLVKNQKASPEWLRILPLGASITKGDKSTPEDGYRKSLREHLKSLGHNINMVGSQTNAAGSMQDGEHEGISGARIDQIYNNMDASSKTKPNVYLINAGTNDCQQNHELDGAIKRLEDLLYKAWDKSNKATIILSTLVISDNDSKNPGASERVTGFNIEIRDLVKKLRHDNHRIVLADMNDGFITKKDLNADGIHPTNDGYRKMAAVWTAAILEARDASMLQEREDNGQEDDRPSTNPPN